MMNKMQNLDGRLTNTSFFELGEKHDNMFVHDLVGKI